MEYTISYYNEAVQADILALPIGLLGRYFALTDRMENRGCHLGAEHTKALGDGLFELRLQSQEGIARVFYCTLAGRKIVMLHSFVKKTQKTPPNALRIAKIRTQEIKNANPR